MRKFEVHVCTISDQATPNYIPILDVSLRPKTAILLVSKKMQAKADLFKEVLKHFCNDVQVLQITIEDELELSALKDQLLEMIVQLNVQPDKVGFNITGGTKLMAIEAYMLAQNLGCEPFYFVPESNEVLWLTAQEGVTGVRQKSVPKNVTVEDYLQLHGFKIKNRPTKRNELSNLDTKELLQELMMLSPTNRGALSHFYGLISSSNARQLQFNISNTKLYHGLEDIILLFEKYGSLTYKNDTITFADEADKKFAHGGWFEEYVFNVVKGMEGIQDCLMNIEIIADDQRNPDKTKNEVDVAYMKDNALHVIECKSKNYDSANNRTNNDILGNSDLFKLETLQKLGGLYTQKIFVSYFDVPGFMKERAAFSRIQLIELDRQANLKAQLLK